MNEKLRKARIDLTLKYPWWASLVLRLDIVNNKEKARGTMSTDGRHIYYSQEFLDELSREEIVGVLAHEGLHCGFLHIERIGEKNEGKWNSACDFAINGILIDSGQVLPKGGLYDPQYDGMIADEIYHLLPDSYKSPKWGFIIEGDGEGRALTEEEKSQWRDALSHALTELRKRGKLGNAWDRAIESAMAPRVPWRELLASLLQTVAGQEDYTWRRPSRRSHLAGVTLPGRFDLSCLPIGIAIDTSGSIGTEELSQAVMTVRQVAEDMRIEKIIILEADEGVRKHTELFSGDTWSPPSLCGGGGTSFIPAIEKLEEESCATIIYITDLLGYFPDTIPITPVIWLTRGNEDVPFGQVVRVRD